MSDAKIPTRRWREIERLFLQATELPLKKREAFLREACTGDDELYREVTTLLEADQTDDRPVSLAVKSSVISLAGDVEWHPGQVVAVYQLDRELGSGGMGEVYLAHRIDGQFEQQVAIKFVRPFASERLVRRFKQERQILAQLSHPGIAMLTDGGISEDGRPFIVMEFVDGSPLLDYVDQRRLPIRDRIELFIQVCEAVDYAHQHDVVHRDLKPSNIIINQDGRPKLLDFGAAKLFSPETPDDLTATGQRIFTPAFASPEQILGKPITRTSDNFSLGAILYELLCGCPMYEFGTRSLVAIARLVRSFQPVAPSDRLSRLAAQDRAEIASRRSTSSDELKGQLAGSLDRIVIKATQNLPRWRFKSAKDLANSLQAHLDGKPQPAEPVVIIYRAIRRYGVGLLAAAVVVVALVSFVVSDDPKTLPAGLPELATTSIAVVPFIDESVGRDQEFFADGLSDTLMVVLSQVSGLRVTGRTSSFYFKGSDVGITEIAQDLDVGHVLKGSIRKSGDRIRVMAQLIRASDGSELWSNSYDRKLADILAVHDQIAQEVVQSLKVGLLDAEGQRLAHRHQPTLDAYEQLIRGRQEMAKRTAESLAAAEQNFRQAIELDPYYALAYVDLADTYYLQWEYGGLMLDESLERREPLIENALRLDPGSGEAYTARAWFLFNRRDFDAAEQDFLRAIELNPNYVRAHHWYSLLLRNQGRFDEAVTQIKLAAELDPMAPVLQENLAKAAWNAGRVEQALTLIRRNIERNPEFPGNYGQMAMFQAWLGHVGEAQRWTNEARKWNPEAAGYWLQECIGLLHLGDGSSAEVCGNRLSETHPEKIETTYVRLYQHMYREEWNAAAWTLESYLQRPSKLMVGFMTRGLADLIAAQGDSERARRLMAETFPELLEDNLDLAATDLDAALVFAGILHATGETGQRDVLLMAMEDLMATMHRTRGTGFGSLDVYIHAIRGDHELAIAGLREAIDMGWRVPVDFHASTWPGASPWWMLGRDWKLESLRQDPEFNALLNELEADISEQRQWYEGNKDKPLSSDRS